MFYIAVTVLTNVIVSVIFKMFGKWDIDILQAIVVNYCVCVATGCLFTGVVPFNAETVHAAWFPWTIVMGISFIAIFNLMAWCTRISGITPMVLANKLSLVIPVVCSILLFHERAGAWRIAGILTALPAVWLSTTRGKDEPMQKAAILWPLLLFFASGGLDTLVNYIQATYLRDDVAQGAATIICFATAALSGIILLSLRLATGRTRVKGKNVLAGIALGIPNFFSILFLVKALHSNVLASSAAIPVINISILVLTSLSAIVLFREPAGKARIAGLLLAVIAIILIRMG